MTLDIDIFFYKLNDSITKKVYMAAVDVLLMFCYYYHVAIIQTAATEY